MLCRKCPQEPGWDGVPQAAGHAVEKGPGAKCHSGPPKVEAPKEEEEIVPAHGEAVGNRRQYGQGARRWGAWALTCWWVRCPSSLYPSARTRAPSREISVWMWW